MRLWRREKKFRYRIDTLPAMIDQYDLEAVLNETADTKLLFSGRWRLCSATTREPGQLVLIWEREVDV